MNSRREFLEFLAAAGLVVPRPSEAAVGGVLSGSVARAPRVVAAPSLLHAHPDGERTLVRFRVFDTDVPAGRLRLFGTDGGLLGTAGVIRDGDHLYGELWIRLTRRRAVTSMLEIPGRRTPLRTGHTLTPQPRWTLHWITIADPAELDARLAPLPIWNRAVEIAALHDARVGANPFRAPGRPLDLLDHPAFLRTATAARRVEEAWGIPASPVALADVRVASIDATPLALAGAGIGLVVLAGGSSTPGRHPLQSRDGASVVAITTGRGSDPASLGFGEGGDRMTDAIESWLALTPPLLSTPDGARTGMVFSTDIERLRAMHHHVDEWNSRFAFPRIVIGGVETLLSAGVDTGPALSSSASTATDGGPPAPHPAPGPDALRRARDWRHADARARLTTLIDPLARLLGSSRPGVEGMVERMAFPVAGHLVFNPSPLSRSDLADFPDGSRRMVTNAPALGYVYLPDLDRERPAEVVDEGVLRIAAGRWALALDPVTGSIASLTDRAGSEWSAVRYGGLNHIDGARLVDVARVIVPGVGTRLEYHRRTTQGVVASRVMLYDELGWIDITNRTESDRLHLPVRFGFEVEPERVAWETPGGFEERNVMVGAFAHLRWVELDGPSRQVLIRGLDTPWWDADVTVRDGPFVLTSLTPGGTCRYRLQAGPPSGAPETGPRFGWDAEPLRVVAVSRQRGVELPGFSRLLRIDPGAMVVGCKPADRGFGIVVYLQEVMGFAHDVRIEPALLGFAGARLVDFVERDLDRPVSLEGGAARVPVPAWGIVAVRLSGLDLRGG